MMSANQPIIKKKKTITAIVKKEELEYVKSLLEIFKDKMSNLKIGTPNIGELRNTVIITFKIVESQYDIVVEKLVFNKIKIINRDKKAQNAIRNANSELKRSQSVKGKGWDDVKVTKYSVSSEELEAWAREGKYIKLIKISKDTLNYSKDVVEKALVLVNPAVDKFMKELYKEAVNNPMDAKKQIAKLLEIASDPSLKSLNKKDLILEAGRKAIEISSFFRHLNIFLIQISNNSKLHYIINFESALKLFAIIEEQKDNPKYEQLINETIKKLNVKWLEITLDTISGKFSSEDQNKILDLISYIKEMRK